MSYLGPDPGDQPHCPACGAPRRGVPHRLGCELADLTRWGPGHPHQLRADRRAGDPWPEDWPEAGLAPTEGTRPTRIRPGQTRRGEPLSCPTSTSASPPT